MSNPQFQMPGVQVAMPDGSFCAQPGVCCPEVRISQDDDATRCLCLKHDTRLPWWYTESDCANVLAMFPAKCDQCLRGEEPLDEDVR